MATASGLYTMMPGRGRLHFNNPIWCSIQNYHKGFCTKLACYLEEILRIQYLSTDLTYIHSINPSYQQRKSHNLKTNVKDCQVLEPNFTCCNKTITFS